MHRALLNRVRRQRDFARLMTDRHPLLRRAPAGVRLPAALGWLPDRTRRGAWWPRALDAGRPIAVDAVVAEELPDPTREVEARAPERPTPLSRALGVVRRLLGLRGSPASASGAAARLAGDVSTAIPTVPPAGRDVSQPARMAADPVDSRSFAPPASEPVEATTRAATEAPTKSPTDRPRVHAHAHVIPPPTNARAQQASGAERPSPSPPRTGTGAPRSVLAQPASGTLPESTQARPREAAPAHSEDIEVPPAGPPATEHGLSDLVPDSTRPALQATSTPEIPAAAKPSLAPELEQSPSVVAPMARAPAAQERETPGIASTPRPVEERRPRRPPPTPPERAERPSAPGPDNAAAAIVEIGSERIDPASLFAPKPPGQAATPMQWLERLRAQAAAEAGIVAEPAAAAQRHNEPRSPGTARRTAPSAGRGATPAGHPGTVRTSVPADMTGTPHRTGTAKQAGPAEPSSPSKVPSPAPVAATATTTTTANTGNPPSPRGAPRGPGAPSSPMARRVPARPPVEPTPMGQATRRFLRPLVGIDPGEARVFIGPGAERLTAAHSADALAVGHEIALAPGHPEREPESLGLLAHEMTHVARARSRGFVPPVVRGDARPELEQPPAATHAGQTVASSSQARDEESLARRVESSVRGLAAAEAGPSGELTSDLAGPATAGSQASGLDVPPDQSKSRDKWGALPAPWEPLPAPVAHAPAGSGEVSGWSSAGESPSAPSAGVSDGGALAAGGLHLAARDRPQGTEESGDAPSSSGAAVGAQAPDVDALARQVYEVLKRRLAAERRRSAH